MSESKLREEYEAMFGAVVGVLKLYDDKGNRIYFENSNDYWSKREFDVNGNEIYYENSKGLIRDKRSCNDKVFIDEQSGKKFKITEIK